jgi:IK cytokine
MHHIILRFNLSFLFIFLLYRAAFQYGVKMADGRKTRRAGPKDEKAELDKQWQKIQNILAKRKTGEAGSSGGKKAKY